MKASSSLKNQVVKFDKFLGPDLKSADYQTAVTTYNFKLQKDALKNNFGVSELKLATSYENLEDESVVTPIGQVLAMWEFTWLDKISNKLQYYLLYFNELSELHYIMLFDTRDYDLKTKLEFTSAPVGISYSIEDDDYMIFSSPDNDTYIFGGRTHQSLPNAPRLISLCAHDNRLYAITATPKRSLVYSDNLNLFDWKDEITDKLSFSDERGNPTKVISFDDYLYVFREYGITRVSTYSTAEQFSVNHIFQSSSYIHPGSIASDGENIYFLTTDGFYSFNGASVKRINLDFIELFNPNQQSSAVCFESKYYLACRMVFDDEKFACETEENFVNNAIFIYDISSGETQIVRGLDVKQFVALKNPYKSKVVMCFNGANKNKIGQIEQDGIFFDQEVKRVWSSPFSDFGIEGEKKIVNFSVKATVDCLLTISSDKDKREFKIKANKSPQTIRAQVKGRKFKVVVETTQNGEISELKLCVTR